jgi:hypothetical protein
MTMIDTAPTPSGTASPAQRLRAATAAVRLGFEWFGVRKTLNADQKTQAAQPFGAEGQYLSAAKKLLDTRHPAFKSVTAVKGRIVSYWKGMTLPFPEAGVRLIRQDQVEVFNDRLSTSRDELAEAVAGLDNHYAELRETARDRLGSLYNVADYPSSLVGMFAVEWSFPSVEPPDYLLRLNPRLYEDEHQRMAKRFEQAVTMAEDAFLAEFTNLVDHLTERLTLGEDGTPKVFRDSAMKNLHAFFERFRSLNVSSNEQLDQLVVTAQQMLRGIRPGQLRHQDGLRQRIASQLASVGSQLEGMMVDRPRRRVLRTRKTNGSE